MSNAYHQPCLLSCTVHVHPMTGYTWEKTNVTSTKKSTTSNIFFVAEELEVLHRENLSLICQELENGSLCTNTPSAGPEPYDWAEKSFWIPPAPRFIVGPVCTRKSKSTFQRRPLPHHFHTFNLNSIHRRLVFSAVSSPRLTSKVVVIQTKGNRHHFFLKTQFIFPLICREEYSRVDGNSWLTEEILHR